MRTITESESTPKADGFFMPAEFAPQDRVWMGWPHRTDTWAHGAKPAQKQYAAIARAIAEFTPVTMCANQADYANCKAVFENDENVTVIEMTKTLAANEGGAGRAVLITRMLSKGVHVLTEAKVTEITEDAISYEKDGEIHTIADADTLVLAMGYRPNTKLADDLAAAGVAIHVLGDANKCGNIRDAIGDGYKIACEL